MQGIYPGSLALPINFKGRFLTKRDKLLELYKRHFKENLSMEAVLKKASEDRSLAAKILINVGGQLTVTTRSIMNSNYFKRAINAFVNNAKGKNLITDVLGQGVHGLTLLMQEEGCDVVIKLPVNPNTDFDGKGFIALENEYDHTAKISQIEDLDHELVVKPIDELGIRGKLLAFNKLGGKDFFDRDHYSNSKVSAFAEYRDRETFEARRMAQLIKVYMRIYQNDVPTLSYGSPHNTRLVEDGKALALYDLCSQPPMPNHNLLQLNLQKKLFGNHALACALFQVLSNGNINFLVDGDIPNKFRSLMEQGQPRLERFYAYREMLLKNALQVLLDEGVVTRAELITNLESLRDVNLRIDKTVLEYLKFKGWGKLIREGEDLAQRLVVGFKQL